MYPSRFDYVAPETLLEAVSLLAQRDDAKVLAGGQSLIPVLKLRVASVGLLVDINRIEELHGLVQKEGYLRVGALVRHRDCERSNLLKGRYGVLGSAAPQVSDPIVRNLGTVCGSVAHADPQGDWGSVLLAANATLAVRGPDGTRQIPVSEFLL